jgi:hypothetical protein
LPFNFKNFIPIMAYYDVYKMTFRHLHEVPRLGVHSYIYSISIPHMSCGSL